MEGQSSTDASRRALSDDGVLRFLLSLLGNEANADRRAVDAN
jgi:hypothetical protein